MYRTIRCAAAALFIASQAIAQEKVSLPSTDADLTGGAPTMITGYFYKPAGAGPFAAVVSMPGCDGPHCRILRTVRSFSSSSSRSLWEHRWYVIPCSRCQTQPECSALPTSRALCRMTT
jgi:hypothetical protein